MNALCGVDAVKGERPRSTRSVQWKNSRESLWDLKSEGCQRENENWSKKHSLRSVVEKVLLSKRLRVRRDSCHCCRFVAHFSSHTNCWFLSAASESE